MPKLPRNVRKHGKQFIFRARVNGETIVRQLGEDEAEARRLGRLFREEVLGRRLTKVQPSGTVAEFAETWLKIYVPRHRREKDHALAKSRMENYILPILGKHQLSQVRRSHLEELVASLETRKGLSGRPLSVRTQRAILTDARCLFSYAVDCEKIDHSPFAGRRILPPAPASQPDPFSDLELARVLAALREPYQSAAIFAVRTGCRWGEQRDLKWANVTLGDRPSILLTHTKNGRWRRVPLDEQAVEVLERWKEETEGQAYVMSWRPNGPRSAADSTRSSLKFAWTWKQFRSTAGTRWLREGIPVEVVSRLLGHSNVLVTTAHYADISEATVREVFERVNRGIGQKVGQNLAKRGA